MQGASGYRGGRDNDLCLYELPNDVAKMVEKGHRARDTLASGVHNGPQCLSRLARIEASVQDSYTVIRSKTGERQTTVRHGITPLAPERADVVQLLAFSQNHWGIENGPHWVRMSLFVKTDPSCERG